MEEASAMQFERSRYAYWIFVLLGLVALFPYNAFLKSEDFLRDRFVGSSVAGTFSLYLLVGFTVTNSGFVVLLNMCQLDRLMKAEKRLEYSLYVFAAVCLVTAVLPFTRLDANAYFGLVLALVVISGLTTANFQNALCGMGAMFPGIYMQAIFTGQGMAGMAVSLSYLIISWAKSSHTDTEDRKIVACAYFLVALVAVVASYIGLVSLRKLALYKHYTTAEKFTVLNDGSEKKNSSDSLLLEDQIVSRHSVGQVFGKIRLYAVSVFLVFFVTLSVIMHHLLVRPASSAPDQLYSDLFAALAFSVFDLGDIIGKALPGWRFFMIRSQKTLFLLTLLRFVFFPLFVFSNVNLIGRDGSPLPIYTSQALASDVGFFAIAFAHAVTNGYLGSMLMIAAPMSVETSMRERAGSLMAMFLTLGVAAGAVFSFAIRAVHCRCNPFVS